MKIYETIIIGGGISGLACGKTLHKHKRDFLLLTGDLGGRMFTSKTGMIDYGASYVTSDYTNVSKYIDKEEEIGINDCYFIDKDNFITLFSPRMIWELPKLIKLYFIARDFRKRLNELRRRALHEQQKDILKSDPVLNKYVKQSAKTFVKKNKLEYINDAFLNPLFHSTGFVNYDKSNTFFYLDNLMAVFCKLHIADFRKAVKRLTKGWKNKIKMKKVTKVTKEKEGYNVKAGGKIYHAKNVVIAVPYKDAIKFHKVPKPKQSVPVYVFNVVGEREEVYQNKKVIFFKPRHHDITILWKQPGGSDVIFSKFLKPNLKKYYKNPRITKRVYWDTALTLSGKEWTDQNLGKGLYLASEYNICGLEDAFITGVYAANQILKK